MVIAKGLDFDAYFSKLNLQKQADAFSVLAKHVAEFNHQKPKLIEKVFDARRKERTFGMGDGVAIFDVRTNFVSRPVLSLMTFDNKLDFNALDNQPVDIMVSLVSPQEDGPKHLQKLANVSRLMRSEDLRIAIRDAKTNDALRVLFLPSHDWMVAA